MTRRLTREEFHIWAESQRQRYERIAGEPVAMSPERAMHVRLKNRVWAALDRAIRGGGLDCEALGDGVPINIGSIRMDPPGISIEVAEVYVGAA